MGQSAQVVGTRATGMVVYGSSRVRRTSVKKRATTFKAVQEGGQARKALARQGLAR